MFTLLRQIFELKLTGKVIFANIVWISFGNLADVIQKKKSFTI